MATTGLGGTTISVAWGTRLERTSITLHIVSGVLYWFCVCVVECFAYSILLCCSTSPWIYVQLPWQETHQWQCRKCSNCLHNYKGKLHSFNRVWICRRLLIRIFVRGCSLLCLPAQSQCYQQHSMGRWTALLSWSLSISWTSTSTWWIKKMIPRGGR